MQSELIEWKWSNGEKMEKSPRVMKQYVSQEPIQQASQYVENNPENLAYQQSLLSENDTWSLDGPQFINDMKPLNKREDNYNRMSEREMFGQINQNPFLVSNKYIDDLMVQDKFLKPISTSIEKEKNNINE
jgi:hypothetical protein|uniref:Uncharacterized protein n=1 Tax=viral metagenome TaxID=1070528 RepID=A0A6C0CVS0_9ZZZZ